MNLNEFLKSEGLNKTSLAERIEWSPQALHQSLQRHSSTFLMKMNSFFPDYRVMYSINEEYIFEKIDADFDSSTIVHGYSKQALFEILVHYPHVYSFVAAIECDNFDVCFDTTAYQNIEISRRGDSGRFGSFPSQSIPDFASLLILAEKDNSQ